MKKIVMIFAALIISLPWGRIWAEQLVITGSTTVQPIAVKIAESYKATHKAIDIKIVGGGSGNGIKAIIDGTTDIGNTSRFIKKKELKYAHGKGVYPVPFQIAYDCIIPIVNPENKIKTLTIEQLRSIYIGSVNNWKEVSDMDRPIIVISRDTSSGTYEIWEKKIMDGQGVFPGAQLAASNKDVLKKVTSKKNAIGYIGLGYLESGVKPIQISKIDGTVKTALDGTYPLSRPLFMFTRGWPNGETLKFINYVLNPATGQKAVKACGFVALYETETCIEPKQLMFHSDPNYIAEIPANIQMVQQYLKVLGYQVGVVDGIKGGKTISAMIAFQKQNNLTLEWKISNKMISLLSDQYLHSISTKQ